MTDETPNITNELAAIRAREETLKVSLEVRIDDLLAELATLCTYRGPIPRSRVPDGVLRKRERKAKTSKPRKAKAEVL